MASRDWDGKISNLKISEFGFPELHQELSKMHHKERGDRLRSLALIGLYSLRGGLGGLGAQSPVSAQAAPVEPVPVETETKVDEKKGQLKGKLLGSLKAGS